MPDELSTYYADFLDGTYDCVDRIVLNAYFRWGQTPGGFRCWWRKWKGSDDDLDNAHLMRLAGRLSRRVRAHAKAHQIPLLECEPGDRKHEMAEAYLPKAADFVGVFLIWVGRAPAPVWDVQRSRNNKIVNLERKYPYVNHYFFHLMDPDWGHVTIKLSGHPPFGAPIILNGHEYVAHQAQKEGLRFIKDGNCLTEISDPTRLAQIADTLCTPDIIGRLSQVCERWIYSACLCFALDLVEQEQSGFHYEYSVYQGEYSRNLLFRRGSEMEQLVQGLVDRTRRWLDVPVLKTLLGMKKRPTRRQGKPEPRVEVVVERPQYDLTVFKLHFGKLTVKLYTKGEHVLRVEAIVHNTKALPCGRSLPKFAEIVTRLKAILIRFLNVVRCVDAAGLGQTPLDEWPTPSQVGRARGGGVDLNQPRMRAVIEAVLALAAMPQGFSCSQVAAKVREILGVADTADTARQAAYDLKKLRGKQVVHPIDHTRRYETVLDGLQAMVALLLLREKVIQPVLAGAGKPKPGPKPKNQSVIDAHYRTLQITLRNLFQAIGLAA
jgi:hypothetical protein